MDYRGSDRPRRGDLVHTNVGNRRERTCLILRVRKGRIGGRFNIWAERWWEMETDLRMRLFRSVERVREQRVIYFRRHVSPRSGKYSINCARIGGRIDENQRG